MNQKKIEEILKKYNKLLKKLFKLENSKNSKKIENIFIKFFIPPKKALLKMAQVSRLYKLKQKGNWDKDDYILVVEPQNYNKITKLTPKTKMFQKNHIVKKKSGKYIIGSFHSGKSGLAQSGDGGDNGDLWWIVNDSLERWLIKLINKDILKIIE